MSFNGTGFLAYVHAHIDWSRKTFGPGARTEGLIKHIKKELDEVAAAPTDLSEWVDVIILAIDGAWRAGHSPGAIAVRLRSKQVENMAREWPDWRTVKEGEPIGHIRDDYKYMHVCLPGGSKYCTACAKNIPK